jgi:hypothetical protein
LLWLLPKENHENTKVRKHEKDNRDQERDVFS